MRDPTKRFSSRVENYVKYRPSYPQAVIQTLQQECELTPTSVVADIGSGTGILTKLLLEHGNPVFAVEPNQEMQEAAQQLLSGYANFTPINGTAEATTLTSQSIDLIVAGQAFHWFEPVATRAEFARILRPQGWVALIWNARRIQGTAFMRDYEALLHQYSSEYKEVGHQRAEMDDGAIAAFFGQAGCKIVSLPNSQHFDAAGLQGRLLSSSYSPEPGHPDYAPMLDALHKLFDQHQIDGRVSFEYETKIYLGRLT